MPKLIVLVLVLVLALEGRSNADVVVLADSDPELLHAVESSLAPWKLTIVVDARPIDEATATRRADEAGARFVVWREGDQLVVYDRTTNAAERRPARIGAFDNVSAAAAALTVKTMMRLPPPAEGAPPPPPPPLVEETGGVGVRLEVGGAGRVSPSSDAGFSARLVLGAMLQPSTSYRWRLGLRGDLGTSMSVDRSGTTGTWKDWSVLAAASWTYAIRAWEIEPWVGVGVTRGSLDVSEATTSMARHDRDTLFGARVGAIVRRRFGLLTTGAVIDLSLTPGAPVYTKTTMGMGAPTVFEAPSFSIVFGIVLAVDLGG